MFLPGEFQQRGSLVGCRLWGRKESETTEWLNWTDWIPENKNQCLYDHLIPIVKLILKTPIYTTTHWTAASSATTLPDQDIIYFISV